MEVTPRRRRALSTFLALVLAAESVSVVAAAGISVRYGTSGEPPIQPVAAAQPPAPSLGATVGYATSPESGPDANAAAIVNGAAALSRARLATAGERVAVTGLAVSAAPRPATVVDAAANAKAAASGKDASTKTKATATRTKAPATNTRAPAQRTGRNHVWIPSLGIDRSVSWFPCDRKRPPDNYVYRWGCAGANNVYLMGHAYSVFKPLHDAYVRGRLRVGLTAYYADAKGKVHTYKVRWWKVTAPTTAASWAWASLGRPSMTLQTCVGKNSAYRLMVRLVQVKA